MMRIYVPHPFTADRKAIFMINDLKDTDKSYIAGIIDGEGSIMLLRNNSNEHPSPCVSVASSTKELLQYLINIIGKGMIKNKKNYMPEKHQNTYTYIIRGNDALDLLNSISPYLVIHTKKLRAKILIGDYKRLTMRNGRYTKMQLEEKEALYQRFIEIR